MLTRDHSSLSMKFALKKLFGALALLIGTALLVWLVYNLFSPTPQFKRSFSSVFQLGVPIVMLWIGWGWLTAKRQDAGAEVPETYPHFVFAKIMDPISATERGRKYADPLHEALEERSCGKVSGGGTETGNGGRVAWVGLDIELADLEGALELTRHRLRELGAPPGSVLEYQVGDQNVVVPITTESDRIRG